MLADPKHGKRMKVEDFMPSSMKPEKKQSTDEQLEEQAMQLAKLLGGEIGTLNS